MTRIGVITGMTREADCLDGFPIVRVAGASSERAYDLATALIADGCEALLSFGTAGGLVDGLEPGDLVLADKVFDADGRVFETDAAWRERLLAELDDDGVVRSMTGSATVVATPDKKRALGLATSAAAVDMESHAIGCAAVEAGVAFLVVRVVADPVHRGIPEWVFGSIREDGRTNYVAVLSGLAKHPWDLPALIGLAGNNAKAMATLGRVAGLAGPLFRFQ
ncbi:MAG: nucleoside phosphorylase [Rhodospirillales bacterium]